MTQVATAARDLYLDLLEDSLFGVGRVDPLVRIKRAGTRAGRLMQRLVESRGLVVARPESDDELAITSNDALTMIGRARMQNVRYCVETAITDDVPGDLIETGVWRGGASIYMAGIVAAYEQARTVWLADSFQGLPAPSHPADQGLNALHEDTRFAVSADTVRASLARYRLLERARLVEGWFRDTLPGLPGPWAVIRLDGDLYESTTDALTSLYPNLSPGGFLIVDDYGAFDACAKAIHDYRDEHNIVEEIVPVDEVGVYWRKT